MNASAELSNGAAKTPKFDEQPSVLQKLQVHSLLRSALHDCYLCFNGSQEDAQ